MLAGRRAFSGSSTADTMSAILRDEPPPLSPDPVPSLLERVIRRCLEKSPEERFQSARDLAFALRESSERQTASSTPAKVASGLNARHPSLAIGALLIAVAVAAAFNVGGIRERLLGSRGPARVRSLAVLPLENLSGDPAQDYIAEGMTEALTASLAQIRSLKVIARSSAMLYQGSKKPLRETARELGVDAIVEGSFARAGDRVRITARLIQGESEAHLWAKSFERGLGDVLALQGEIALSRTCSRSVVPIRSCPWPTGASACRTSRRAWGWRPWPRSRRQLGSRRA
jgi:TolB-like protein